MTTTTTTADARPAPADAALMAQKRRLGLRSVRILTWKSVLVQSLGRELHALHIQQQERAFMATTHGLAYTAARGEIQAVH
ncbi:MAG: hypothetical protein ACM35H_05640 [Bacteroidota bacterium]|nr:hypothetical protein [Kiloniellaceae bacterium]